MLIARSTLLTLLCCYLRLESVKMSATAASGQKLSRDDWRKKKELEEARKAGTAPAEVDESGKDINPHIPQYISQAPWYVSLNRPSLTHQRTQEEKQVEYDSLNRWYKKGVQEDRKVTKFRKGACENCGSMTHKKKDCLERPRKVGAKYTNKDIKPDEYLHPNLTLTYDGKRDRWNGYNTEEHQAVVEEYAKVEMAKRQLKAERLQAELLEGKLSETSIKEAVHDSDGSDTDEEKYADQADMAGTKFDPKTRTTVRNLRIREDTAKYLYNLDPNSAFYDPKTRSMRENPFKNSKDPTQMKYAGDNFVRRSGTIKDFAKTQMFAWEAYEHGNDIHPLADPTKLEVMHKEFKVNKDDFQTEQKQSVLERYGGEEHLDAPPRELLLAQTEEYMEYSRSGNVVKGQERAVAKSRYEEDVLTNNHTSVWGSYWYQGAWGYACCHSLIKGSYCTGEAGRRAVKAPPTSFEAQAAGGDSEEEDEVAGRKSLVEEHKAKIGSKSRKEREREEKIKEEEKAERMSKALIMEDVRKREGAKLLAMDERKRPYNSLRRDGDAKEPTEEEMEAFRIKRQRQEDPMSAYL